jgi:putative tricarboxylic transport membrane protein
MLESLNLAVNFFLADWMTIVYLMLGVLIGVLFGVIPGLGGTTAVALLLPLTFGMQPEQAITLMGGILGSSAIGGSVAAILLNAPGTAPNAATCFDGYPMTRQGKAGIAIGAAMAASSIGGLIGVAILIVVLPITKSIVLMFGPPAFFMLAVLGLTSLTVASGNLLRGLLAACIGLMIGFVGYDDLGGTQRYTFDSNFLWDGISLVPTLIGLFAIAEMIKLYVEGGAIAKDTDPTKIKLAGTSLGIKSVFSNMPTVFSGSIIGSIVGMVPGVGGTVASFLAYSFASQFTRKNNHFGSGDVRGVIAPEAANNAKDGGSLIPTLAFGIPGSAEMALFLGVLIMHGMTPGPMLLIEREWSIMVLIIALALATLMASLVVLASAKLLVIISFLNSAIIIPAVLAISLVGAYALNAHLGDVVVAVIFGFIGYMMIKFDFPRITLVIALVLGSMMERSFLQSITIFRGDWTGFFQDTTSLIIFCLVVLALAFPTVHKIRGMLAK